MIRRRKCPQGGVDLYLVEVATKDCLCESTMIDVVSSCTNHAYNHEMMRWIIIFYYYNIFIGLLYY